MRAPSNAVERELDLHAEIIKFCNAQWPPWTFVHSDPTRKSRVTPGAPDFVIAIPDAKTLYVECKDREGKLSQDQMEFKKKIEMLGHMFHVVRSMDEFRAIL